MVWAVGQRITAAALNALAVLQNSMELQAVAAQSISTGVNTIATMLAAPFDSGGSGMTGTTNGITIANTGRYLCSGGALFSAGAAGTRRQIGIGTVAGGVNTYSQQIATPSTALALPEFAKELNFTAGDTMALYVYQDSAAAMNVTNRWLAIRQVR